MANPLEKVFLIQDAQGNSLNMKDSTDFVIKVTNIMERFRIKNRKAFVKAVIESYAGLDLRDITLSDIIEVVTESGIY